MKIEDPKILCKGEVSYEARYKNGKITYLYVAPWVPAVVKQRLVQQEKLVNIEIPENGKD